MADLLYKVTKIKLERRVVDYKAHIYGPYQPTRTKVDYRTTKNAVTLAIKSANSGNDYADRHEKNFPNHDHGYAPRYEVKVEVVELPTFIEYAKVEGKTAKETLSNIAAWRSGSASP
jgi:hypothetical protein